MGYVSEISKSALVVNLPEPQSPSVEFTYNFYTRDENIFNGATSSGQTSSVYTAGTATSPATTSVVQNNVSATYIVIPQEGSTSSWINAQRELRLAQARFTLPRQMTLNWAAPNISEVAEKLGVELITDVPVNISDHIDRVIYAEVMGNQMYSGLTMQDLQVDENFYREMKSSMPVINSSLSVSLENAISSARDDDDPTLQTANRLIDNLSSYHSADELTGLISTWLTSGGSVSAGSNIAAAKLELTSLMKNFQTQGITYISDDQIQNHSDIFDETRHVAQHVLLKNTHAADLVNNASLSVETPYADDLVRSGDGTTVLGFFNGIQEVARADPTNLSADTKQFGMQVKAENLVHYTDVDDGFTFTDYTDPPSAGPDYDRQGFGGGASGIGLAGFLIDKKMSYNTDSMGGIAVNIKNNAMIVEVLNTSGEVDGAFGSSGSTIATEIRDGNVPYGARVIYRVRAVYYIEMDAVNVQHEEDKIARVGILVASRGTNFVEALAIEKIPPPAPQNLTFLYDYVNENLILSWDFPTNPQRDIKKFRVWRRSHTMDEFAGEVMRNTNKNILPPGMGEYSDLELGSMDQRVEIVDTGNAYDKPFELLKEYDFSDAFNPGDYTSFLYTPSAFDTRQWAPHLYESTPGAPVTRYVDASFDKNATSIYAVTSVDARGYSSNLSQQFEVSFDIRKNAIVVRYISPSGSPLCYPNLNLTVQYDQSQFNDNTDASQFSSLVKVSGMDRLTIAFGPPFYQVAGIDPSQVGTGDFYTGTSDLETRDVVKFGGTKEGSDNQASGATPVYKLNIINTDVQKSTTIDIYVKDSRTGALPETSAVDRMDGDTIVEGRGGELPFPVL